MITIIDWQAWAPLIQMQIAATVVIAVAAFLEQFVTIHQVVAREWLWRAALIGVLASVFVPVFHRTTLIKGPELAILPRTVIEARPPSNNSVAPTIESASSSVPIPKQPDTKNANELATVNVPRPETPTTLQSESETKKAESPRPSITAGRPLSGGKPNRMTWSDSILRTLLATWYIGIIFHVARSLMGVVICRRIAASAIPLDYVEFDSVLSRLSNVLGNKTLPPISATSKIGSPAVIGTLRPQIVLPVTALEWMSSAQLFQVLLHEAAHITRRDPLINFLQVIARALFWHHPWVYWLNRRLSESRERVCDNFVLAHTEVVDYAETLLEMTSKCPQLAFGAGLPMLAEEGSLEERVTGLLDKKRDRSVCWPLWNTLAMVSGLLLVPIFLGLVRVTERSTNPVPQNQFFVMEAAGELDRVEGAAEESNQDIESTDGRITGQVVFDEDGRVASEATVVLYPPYRDAQKSRTRTVSRHETTSDAEGRFSFDSISPGTYQVWANLDRKTSRKKMRIGDAVNVEGGTASAQSVVLRLVDGVKVVAHVTDKANGEIIPNATIHLGWSDLKGDFHANGAAPVVVQPLTPERWFFEAWADGYGRETRWLNLETSSTADLDFALIPGGALHGTVRDSQGNPIEDVYEYSI